MKTKFLLIISVFISGLAFSQNVTTIGIRGGILSSGIRGDASDNLNQLLDKTGGLVQIRGLKRNVHIKREIFK